MNEVASMYEISFVPIFEKFKARLDAGDDLLADGLHPNDIGHQHIADAVLPTLDAVINTVRISTNSKRDGK